MADVNRITRAWQTLLGGRRLVYWLGTVAFLSCAVGLACWFWFGNTGKTFYDLDAKEYADSPVISVFMDVGGEGSYTTENGASSQLVPDPRFRDVILAVLNTRTSRSSDLVKNVWARLWNRSLYSWTQILNGKSYYDRWASGREMAITQLGLSDDPSRFDIFVKHLKDPAGNVRRACIKELGRLHDDRALDYLIPLLDDPNFKFAACDALSQIRSKRVVHALLSHLNSRDPSYILLTLARVGDVDAIPRVTEVASTHPNPKIRFQAMLTLGLLGSQESVPVMIRAYGREDSLVQFGILISLWMLKSPESADFLTDVLVDMRAQTTPRSIEWAGLFDRFYCGGILKRSIPPYSLEVLFTGEIDVSYAEPTEAFVPLDMLGDDETCSPLFVAALALGRLNEPVSIPRLVDALKHSENARQKTAILVALDMLKDTRCRDAAIEFLASEGETVTNQALALCLLRQYPGIKSSKCVQRAMQSPRPEIRKTAPVVLLAVDPELAAKHLDELSKTGRFEVEKYVVPKCRELDEKTSAGLLRNILLAPFTDPNGDNEDHVAYRKQVADMLAKSADAKTVKPLKEALDRCESESVTALVNYPDEVGALAIYALGQTGDGEWVRPLVAFSCRTARPYLRYIAYAVLAKMDGKQVADAILKYRTENEMFNELIKPAFFREVSVSLESGTILEALMKEMKMMSLEELLASTKDSRLLELLLRVVKKDNFTGNSQLMAGLKLLGPETAIAPLYTLLKSNPDELGIVLTLASLGEQKMKEPLKNALRNKDFNDQVRAAIALKNLGDDYGAQVLYRALTSPWVSDIDKRSVVVLLSEQHWPGVRDQLRNAMKSTSNPGLKDTIKEALAEIDKRERAEKNAVRKSD